MNGGQVATTLVIMSDVEYLLPLDTYQQHFVHIGTQQSSAHMVPFLEDQKQEGTGLYLINLDETNKRFSIVSNFLSKYKPENILVVSARQYGQRPACTFFSEHSGMRLQHLDARSRSDIHFLAISSGD